MSPSNVSFDAPPPNPAELQEATRLLAAARQWGYQNDGQGRALITALLRMAGVRQRQGDSPRALSLINEAKERFHEFSLPLPADLGWRIFRAAGDYHQVVGQDATALAYFQQALTYADAARVAEADLSKCYEIVAACCLRLGDSVHASQYQALAGAGHNTIPAVTRDTAERKTLTLDNRLGQSSEWVVTCHSAQELLVADF